MIEFERTNEKGDRVKAYTHQSYLSHHFNSEINRLKSKYQTWSNTTFFATTIATYWVSFLLFRQPINSLLLIISFKINSPSRENF